MAKVNRRAILGFTGISVTVPILGYTSMNENSSDNDTEFTDNPSNGSEGTPEEISLSAAGYLRVENPTDDPHRMRVTIRSDSPTEQRLFHLDTEMSPDATVFADELLSEPRTYVLEAETEHDQQRREWTVSGSGSPANCIVRTEDDGTLSVQTLATE